METNTIFNEIEEHVLMNTSLTIEYMSTDSITVFGRIEVLAQVDLTIEFLGDGVYECIGSISYQGYDANPADILEVRKLVKSEKEVITLIDKSIDTASKLIITLRQLESEWNT